MPTDFGDLMISLEPCDDLIVLDDLAARVRQSSNFRLAWQSFRFTFDWRIHQHPDPATRWSAAARAALDEIVDRPELHRFLRDSFEPMYADTFSIERLHEHCVLAQNNTEFVRELAGIANDRAGAYSNGFIDPRLGEMRVIRDLFEGPGPFIGISVQPGQVKGCDLCRHHANHVFSSWFYSVAWDWCLLAIWPDAKVLWVGCFTDTD